ncbi:MAG TPA: helicase, partial [Ktedonobacteraceae bacterium]
MIIINLPPVLPGELDLKALNLALLNDEATLDWSCVLEAPENTLTAMFAGLDLVEHSEILGIETVPDHLSEVVLRVLSRSESHAPHRHEHKPPTKNDATPIVWEPEEQHDAMPPLEEAQQPQPVAGPPAETTPSILQPPSPSTLRDELEQLVLQDLLGPAGGPEEELDEGSVRDRYLVGMLAPRDQQIVPEELDELAIPEEGSIEDGPNDDTALQITSLFPSSIGMSFCVDGSATSLSVSASWGYYRREHSESIKTAKGAPKTVWKRQPMGGTPQIFTLKVGPLVPWSPEAEEQPNVVVRGIMRRSEGSWTVTLFLVNEQREPEKRRDEAWVFQPELSVEAPGSAPVFQQRVSFRSKRPSDEEQAMKMLYRQHVSFAIGHGVGVLTETLPGDPTRAVRLSTRVVPGYDVPRTEAPTPIEIPGLAKLTLDMKELAECSVAELPGKLTPLVTAYAAWIAEQTARLDDPDSDLVHYRLAAQQAMAECHHTLERIREGIALLATNAHGAKAFAFMN